MSVGSQNKAETNIEVVRLAVANEREQCARLIESILGSVAPATAPDLQIVLAAIRRPELRTKPPFVSTLQKDKWVRIMADFGAVGLVWMKSGTGTGIEDLPISKELRRHHNEWQRRYDRSCEDYLPESQRSPKGLSFDSHLDQWAAEGLVIAKRIKKELPDWTVVYFDASKSILASDRTIFEYEVTI